MAVPSRPRLREKQLYPTNQRLVVLTFLLLLDICDDLVSVASVHSFDGICYWSFDSCTFLHVNFRMENDETFSFWPLATSWPWPRSGWYFKTTPIDGALLIFNGASPQVAAVSGKMYSRHQNPTLSTYFTVFLYIFPYALTCRTLLTLCDTGKPVFREKVIPVRKWLPLVGTHFLTAVSTPWESDTPIFKCPIIMFHDK